MYTPASKLYKWHQLYPVTNFAKKKITSSIWDRTIILRTLEVRKIHDLDSIGK
jgi:hypothetical protein